MGDSGLIVQSRPATYDSDATVVPGELGSILVRHQDQLPVVDEVKKTPWTLSSSASEPLEAVRKHTSYNYGLISLFEWAGRTLYSGYEHYPIPASGKSINNSPFNRVEQLT